MHTRTTAAAALLAAGLLLTACDGGDDKPAATKPPAPAAAASTAPATPTATTAHPVKLSTRWVPKLDKDNGAAACQRPSATACVNAMTSNVTTLSALLADISAAGATDEYPKTIAQIQKMVTAADSFSKDGCPSDPAADEDSSPCYGDAVTVTVGMTTLQFVMPTDELNAGVS